MSKKKVLFTVELDQSGRDLLDQNDIEIIVSPDQKEETFIKILKEEKIDAIITRVDPITPAMMDASPNLKVVAKHGVGLDNIDVDYATQKGIQVTWAPGGNANSVAEHTLMLLFMVARRVRHVDQELRGGNYNVRYTLKNTYELGGHTLGLIGCGRIGQMLAEKAACLGMKVIGYDPYQKQENMKAPITLKDSKEEVLKEADFISLHLPGTPETHRSFGMADFKAMKKTASLVNCARGEVVNTEDLIEAIKAGEIVGAALDVFEQEPLPMDSPLYDMEEVILTPHTAATTREAVYNCCTMAATGVIEVLKGEPVSYPVNHLDNLEYR